MEESYSCLALILAAGEGRRLRSAKPKVLHPVAGRPMVGHVIASAATAGMSRIGIVHRPGDLELLSCVQQLFKEIVGEGGELLLFPQGGDTGTAGAALAARSFVEQEKTHVLVLFGDTPLIRPETLTGALALLDHGAQVVCFGFHSESPEGYGRLIQDREGYLLDIKEDIDLNPAEQAIHFCNGGAMALHAENALRLLSSVRPEPGQKELYLSAISRHARRHGLRIEVVTSTEESCLGVNTRADLARAEAWAQHRLRHAALHNGTTMTAPETVFFSHDTVLGPDVVIEPHVIFGTGVSVESGTIIRAFCHIEGVKIGKNARIGPFARLRPGVVLGAHVKVGNFVEMKDAQLDDGVSVSHLSYLGNCHVGADANIGAGTITCNYDGYAKSHTEIGAGAFIGSNSSLVAPVLIGQNAYVASGSTITRSVSADSLAIARSPQVEKQEWSKKFSRKYDRR